MGGNMAEEIVKFVIGKLPEREIVYLKNNQRIISKLILSNKDFEIFNYKKGDRIEVQSEDGNRLWCRIFEMEILKNMDKVIIIFTLLPR